MESKLTQIHLLFLKEMQMENREIIPILHRKDVFDFYFAEIGIKIHDGGEVNDTGEVFYIRNTTKEEVYRISDRKNCQ